MSDQYELGPDSVITGPVWNMGPTVDYVIKQVESGSFTALDLKDFSMWAKGGATLAPYHGMEAKVPADVFAKVQTREQEIKDGLFRVNIAEEAPAGAQ